MLRFWWVPALGLAGYVGYANGFTSGHKAALAEAPEIAAAQRDIAASEQQMDRDMKALALASRPSMMESLRNLGVDTSALYDEIVEQEDAARERQYMFLEDAGSDPRY